MLVQMLRDKVCFGLSDIRVCKHSSRNGTVRKQEFLAAVRLDHYTVSSEEKEGGIERSLEEGL